MHSGFLIEPWTSGGLGFNSPYRDVQDSYLGHAFSVRWICNCNKCTFKVRVRCIPLSSPFLYHLSPYCLTSSSIILMSKTSNVIPLPKDYHFFCIICSLMTTFNIGVASPGGYYPITPVNIRYTFLSLEEIGNV